ncbi:MAG: hypothetical protein WDM86_08985 [Rhizomicrobium sp.]
MTIQKFASGSAAVFALVTLAAPAFAFTHHPATPAENAQTDQLNAQALANAQGGAAPTTGAAIDTGATSNTMSNGGMVTGSGMNAGGTDENGNANAPTPNKPTPPAKPNDTDSAPPNGQ